MARYIIENYHVKNIVLAVDPQSAERFDAESGSLRNGAHYKVDGSSAWTFYLKYLFASPVYGVEKLFACPGRNSLEVQNGVCVVETGSVDRRFQDAAPIGEAAEYLTGDAAPGEASAALTYIDEAVAAADIKALCEANEVRLIVLGVSLREEDFYRYDQEQMSLFWEKLAGVTDFYDFWGCGFINRDPRYYYDDGYFRGAVGTMMLARVFENPDVYVPENFGGLITRTSAAERITAAYSPVEQAGSYTAEVPVLM